MTTREHPSRRQALIGGFGFTVAVQLLGSPALANTDDILARRKLVVIVCRGGLDGLSLSPPVGDPNYAALRGAIALPGFGEPGGALPLDHTFGLHPAMPATYALVRKGEARIAPAVATPDRERSHFEAQDVLESGAGRVYATSSGWLNRALDALGPGAGSRAISIGPTAPLILRGPIEAASWSPGGLAQSDDRLPAILQDLYAHDPLLGPALASGLATQTMAKVAMADAAKDAIGLPPGPTTAMGGGETGALAPKAGPSQARKLGATLASFMTQPNGKQVAAVSIDGFDTHANQGAAQGALATRLSYVDAFLDGLAAELGPAWRETVVVMATEFGRTAHVNGTGGTDHGTASTALLLGGSLKPGGIIGDWPTLAQNRLFENRDTAPTLDMRGLFKSVLRDHLGIDRSALDTRVFPGSADVAPISGLIA
jgi:uncharacterized protein (DUF1501 family)